MDSGGNALRADRTRLLWWSGATCAWSLIFAAPHFYWATGSRAGLGAEAAADEALSQSWFFIYNLLAGALAVVGGAAAVMLARRAGERTLRALRAAAWAACAVLSLRGAVGVIGLASQFARGVMDSPPMLVAIEPWFILGGVLFGVLAARTGRSANRPDRDGP